MEKINKMSFLAIEPSVQIVIPEPIQKSSNNKDYVPYGRDNRYPKYLLKLYTECSTLKSIIEGNINFVLGDDIILAGWSKGDTRALISKIVRDYYVFGYAFIQVIRNNGGDVTELYHLKSEDVRTDKDRESFWYSDSWYKSGSAKALVYPRFLGGDVGRTQATSVIMLGDGRDTYPAPIWSSAIRDAEIQVRIEDFHLTELENNFLSSAIVNFNNGIPSSEEKLEIERNISEKFSGSKNAGRMLLSFNNSVVNRTTLERLSSDNFDSRYDGLSRRSREQLFISFRAQPLLFGLTSESSVGFSTQEFSDLFKLYQKTQISPVQDMLVDLFTNIFGYEALTITPFTI